MPKNGRPPPPPKPEELIDVLDKKFEAFRAEMLESMERKSTEIFQLQEADTELKSTADLRWTEIKESLESLKQENERKILEIVENQEKQSHDLKKELEMILIENVEELKDDLGKILSCDIFLYPNVRRICII